MAQQTFDKLAISLSALCALHCIVTPLIVVFMPSWLAAIAGDEAFHLWMVIAVIPISIYALTLGCKKHERYPLLVFGCAGIVFLVLALIVGHDLGEAYEKGLTLLGALLLAAGHIMNYRLCKKEACNSCGS